jgi:hypothetical protein
MKPRFRQDEDAMVCYRNPPYINEELFHGFISQTFIPYFTNLRGDTAFAGEAAVLLMDSMLPHVSERIL